MASKELKTLKELKAAIRKARAVFVTPHFGLSEAQIQINKKAALEYVTSMLNSEDTPESFSMYGGIFGSYDTERNEVELG